MAESKLSVKVTAETQSAENNIKKFSNNLKDVGKAAASLVSISAVVKGMESAFSSLAAVAKECVSAYQTQAVNMVRLESVCRNLGDSTGMAAQEMAGLASSLQSVTVFGDEAIVAAEQLLVSTGKLTGGNLKKATELTLDLATAMGTDATSAAQTLAMALQDPETGLRRLRQAHITFTDAEAASIRSLSRTGKELEAQQLILEKVAATYGGLARDVGSLDVSRFTKVQNLWGDIGEKFGEIISRDLAPLMKLLEKRLETLNERLDVLAGNGTFYPAGTFTADAIAKLGASRGSAAEAVQKAEGWAQRARYALLGTGKFRGASTAAMSDDALLSYGNSLTSMTPAELSAFDAWKSALQTVEDFRTAFGELYSAERSATEAAEAFIEQYGSLSATKQVVELWDEVSAMEEIRKELTKGTTEWVYLGEIIDSLKTKIESFGDKTEAVAEPVKTLSDYLQENIKYSAELRKMELDGQIAEAEGWLEKLNPSLVTENRALQEIIASLRQMRAELDGGGDGGLLGKYRELWGNISPVVDQTVSAMDAWHGFVEQKWEQSISAQKSALREMEENWDRYFDRLGDRYDEDRDALDARYRNGEISAEEYESSLSALDDARAESEDELAERKKDAQAKINELEERKFNADKANSIAQATISGAQAIANIWAQHGANLALAGTLTGLSVLTTGNQIATIAAQTYTPAFSAGGIVTGPTTALVGETGPEAIIPLNKNIGKELGKGVINIRINVENAYDADHLGEAVFGSITKLQRTGALPSWEVA